PQPTGSPPPWMLAAVRHTLPDVAHRFTPSTQQRDRPDCGNEVQRSAPIWWGSPRSFCDGHSFPLQCNDFVESGTQSPAREENMIVLITAIVLTAATPGSILLPHYRYECPSWRSAGAQ